MPVILPDDSYDLWLDPAFQRIDAVCDLLRPFEASLMRGYEISKRVNLVANDDPACAEGVGDANQADSTIEGNHGSRVMT